MNTYKTTTTTTKTTSQAKPSYPGTILSYMYPTTGGKHARSMPLDDRNLGELIAKLESVGPGGKLVIKPTTEEFQKRTNERLKSEGKRGSAPTYIIEVLSAKELADESQRLNSNNIGF